MNQKNRGTSDYATHVTVRRAAKKAFSQAERHRTNDMHEKLNKNNDGRYIYRPARVKALEKEDIASLDESTSHANYWWRIPSSLDNGEGTWDLKSEIRPTSCARCPSQRRPSLAKG